MAKRKAEEEKQIAVAEKEKVEVQKSLKASIDELAQRVGSGVASIATTGVPQNVSYGFIAGFCSGFAAKKAGRVLAVGVGGVYVGLQVRSCHPRAKREPLLRSPSCQFRHHS